MLVLKKLYLWCQRKMLWWSCKCQVQLYLNNMMDIA